MIEIESDGPIAVMTLNDPERLNAMTDTMAYAFRDALPALRGKRAIILTGNGRAFSAGGDLAMLEQKASQDVATNRTQMRGFYHAFLSMLELEIPLIAAVNGLAVGAGFCVAAACDIRLADPAACFSAPFLRLGLYPGMGSTYFLAKRLGGMAADVLLTGSTLNAEDALRCGLVSRISESGKVLALAREMGQQLLLSGPQVTRQLLRVLRAGPGTLAEQLDQEAELQGQSYLEPEFLEGVRAAREKRPPSF